MPGTKRLLAGLAMILAGTIALWIGYSGGDYQIAGLAWALLLLGAILAIMGGSKMYSGYMNPTLADKKAREQNDVRAVVQAIGAIASADGQINHEEVKTIGDIYEKLMGVRISNKEIDEILFDMETDFDVATRLKALKPKINVSLRRKIILSCYQVMIADQNIHKAETIKINTIGTALGFSQGEIDKIIASET